MAETEKTLLEGCTFGVGNISGTDVKRVFVRYRNPSHSDCAVWHRKQCADHVVLSVVIPIANGSRMEQLLRLVRQIEAQDMQDYELFIVWGDSRQGRAINIGAWLSRGKFLLTLDDDTSIPDPDTFRKLVDAMEEHADIGMAGGNNVVPDGASSFVRKAMEQIPRRSWKPVREITDSDLAEHPCLIMRTDVFRCVGGENELIPRGLDPYLRQAFREAGWRVVLVPGVRYHHLLPDSLPRLLRQYFRNGRQAAYVQKYYPQWMIETPVGHGPFRIQVPFASRVKRFPFRLLEAMVKGKPIWLASELAYALGFVCEFVGFGKWE